MSDMCRIRSGRAGILVALALFHPAPANPQGTVDPRHGMVAVGGALRELGAVKRVLVIGAHPDDEDTALLTWLERGVGADAAYLSLNRGEGGQNLIGPELGVGLGLIRTGELVAARALDGAEQFFTRVYDFGYSRSAEETFRFWPKESVLADVVATIREFRPQVVVSIFSGTPRDGHGQHQVAGIVAREAFEQAGDPTRFPEQLEGGLEPWRPVRLYRSARFDRDAATLTIRTGELDPLYGRSYHQIAMAGRSKHRSQDMGRVESLGPRFTYLQLLSPAPGTNGGDGVGLFAGVDTTFAGALEFAIDAPLPDSTAAEIGTYVGHVSRARDAFLSWSSNALVDELAAAHAVLEPLAASETVRASAHARFLLARERAKLESALLDAAGVVIEAFADDDLLVPAQQVEVAVQVWNSGAQAIRLEGVRLLTPEGWPVETAEPPPTAVAADTLVEASFRLRVPRDAQPSHLYFLAEPMSGALYQWPDDYDVRGRPFSPPPLQALVELSVAGRALHRDVEVVYRYADQAIGEIRHPLHVVPAVGVALRPAVSVRPLNTEEPLVFTVSLRGESPDGTAGSVRLLAPRGWGVSPAEQRFDLVGPGAEGSFEFRVAPPTDIAPGTYSLSAEAESRDGRRYRLGYSAIDYPHIRRSLIFERPEARVEAFDLKVDARRVGYVPGAGDAVVDAIVAMGERVDMLSDRAIQTGDLSAYDVIVIGIRAYETNSGLLAANERLLEWVRAGGTLIVQYQQYAFFRGGYAPYEMSAQRPHDRVSDETGPVKILEPHHPAFNSPNRIGPADFEGWVQERGLYFPHEWDDHYTPLLESADPGEEPKRGALLVASYGEGLYVYTGLSLFRQLPAGVPGAYRLMANLLSLRP